MNLRRLTKWLPPLAAKVLRPRFLERSYDGGGGGRRWRGAGEQPNTPLAILAARSAISRRARYLVGNNPLANSGVAAWTSALVGTGIKLQSTHPDPTVRAQINAAFEAWTDFADADGLSDFYGQQAMVASRLCVDGECLAIHQVTETGRYRLRLLDIDQLDSSMTRELGGGSRIVQGIEFDASGTRTYFHIFKERPGISTTLASIRVPAENVCHVFRVEAPGQVRGLSWFAPVLLRLREHDEAIDAQLLRQKVAAMLCAFVVDPTGAGAGFPVSGDTPSLNGILEGGMEPGTIKVLNSGQDIRISEAAPIGAEAIQFLNLTAREIASGLGVPYESLTGDLSQVNFSSIRAGLIEFRRRVEAIQHSVLAFQFLRPVYRRWLTMEILSGRMKAEGFERDPELFLSCKWINPRAVFVDPQKDVEAELAAIAGGLMSRREAVASRGVDIEALDAEIAADNARTKSLGLDFTAKPEPKKEMPAS